MLLGTSQQQFDFASPPSLSTGRARNLDELAGLLRAFREFGTETLEERTRFATAQQETREVPAFVNEFWTAGQRQAHSLHEISYRACFKPQLPRFFIERLTVRGEMVYDPFMGRGTTLLEAALLGRVPAGNDVNPLSRMLLRPRLDPPALEEVERKLAGLRLEGDAELPEELLVFYHPETLREIIALKEYLLMRSASGDLDAIDEWIRMVAINRLTGHSPGFFSVYTLPPNQATSARAQRRINEKRNQIPPRRDVKAILRKKSRQLLKDLDAATGTALHCISKQAVLSTAPASNTPALASDSVSLVVTSPPFLDVVDYAGDNWLRCWFAGIDPATVQITVPKSVQTWEAIMTDVFVELRRVLRTGGHVAFEVGEVKNGSIKLEESVLRSATSAGLSAELVLINQQEFTKTANCWGVDNNSKGTNSNRIVLLRKD